MSFFSKKAIFCIAANCIGIGWLSLLLFKIMAESGGTGMANDANTAISWFFTAFPFLVMCVFLDLYLLIVAIRSLRKKKDYRLGMAWIIIVAGWFFTMAYVRNHVNFPY